MAKINLKAYRNRLPNASSMQNLLMMGEQQQQQQQQEMNQLFNITMLLGRKNNNNNRNKDTTTSNNATREDDDDDEHGRTTTERYDDEKFSRIEKKIENNLTYISISVDNTDTGSIVNYNGIMENCTFFDIEDDEIATLNAWSKKKLLKRLKILIIL